MKMLHYSALATIPFLIIWEYIARGNVSNIKPSYALSKVATWSIDFWYATGRLLARISSFYTYINFKDLIETCNDLFKPIFDILISPFQLIKGYINVATIYEHPYIVGFGSVTLIALISWIVYYMRWHEKIRSYLY